MRRCADSLLLLVPLVGMALLCAPATAAPSKARPPLLATEAEPVGFRTKSQALVLQPINLDTSRFAFTAPGRITSSQVQTAERGFSFTPAGNKGKRALSIGMTARTVAPVAADRTAYVEPGLSPSGYNVDLSVGWRGFALSGGVTKLDTGLGGRSRSGVDLGVNYATRNWRAGVAAFAEREGGRLGAPNSLTDPRYSVEARGAFSLSPKVSLGGSLRYRMAPETPTPLDPTKDDQAVMLGGSFAF